YHQDRLPDVHEGQPHDLFSVLGTVSGFRDGTAVLNMQDFKKWLTDKERTLQNRIASWIPDELSAEDRADLLAQMKGDCIAALEGAIKLTAKEEAKTKKANEE